MSLTNATAYNQLTWSQQQDNVGFSPTIQGPDTFSFTTSYEITSTGVNSVYAVEAELLPLASVTIDLQALTDFFNQAMTFTRVYSIQVRSVGADLQWGPGAVDPCVWFFNTASDRVVVKTDSDFMYNTNYPFAVTAGAKNLDFYNTSASESLTYSIAIIGGQGAGTTSTTSTTATTVTSSTTQAPTSTTSSSSSSSSSSTSSSSSSTAT